MLKLMLILCFPLAANSSKKKMNVDQGVPPAPVNGHADDELSDYKRLDDVSTIGESIKRHNVKCMAAKASTL